jgi:hypothetical protein
MGEYGTTFQNEPVDVSEELARQENHFFVGVGSSACSASPRAASCAACASSARGMASRWRRPP